MVDVSEVPDQLAHPAHGAAPLEVVNQVGDSLPLGLAGFGMTAIVLSCFNAGWFNATAEGVALPMALFYGGIVVLLSGMWAFRRNETFPAVVLSALGAFWLGFAGYAKFVLPALPAATAGDATGLYLVVWAVFCGYVLVPALKTNVAVFAVLVGTASTFLLLAIGNFAGATDLVRVGGILGVLTGAVALYTSCALLTNTAFGRVVLPVRPLG